MSLPHRRRRRRIVLSADAERLKAKTGRAVNTLDNSVSDYSFQQKAHSGKITALSPISGSKGNKDKVKLLEILWGILGISLMVIGLVKAFTGEPLNGWIVLTIGCYMIYNETRRK
jgi:hypothetical protein